VIQLSPTKHHRFTLRVEIHVKYMPTEIIDTGMF